MPNNNLYNQTPLKDSAQLYSLSDNGRGSKCPPSGDGGYDQLLAAGLSKQEIHSAIHQFLLHEIACKKAYRQLPLTRKIQRHIQRYFRQATAPFRSLTQKGLTLLKTQFAKKPKNPV